MKAPEDRSVSHSISCKPLQWMRMQELAERAGRPTSPFIVDRVLKRDGFGDGQDGHALVLDQDGQREMQEAAVRAEAALSELLGPAGGSTPGLAAMVGMLFEARLDEMAREGCLDEMLSLLAPVTGPDRAAAIVQRAAERVRPGG